MERVATDAAGRYWRRRFRHRNGSAATCAASTTRQLHFSGRPKILDRFTSGQHQFVIRLVAELTDPRLIPGIGENRKSIVLFLSPFLKFNQKSLHFTCWIDYKVAWNKARLRSVWHRDIPCPVGWRSFWKIPEISCNELGVGASRHRKSPNTNSIHRRWNCRWSWSVVRTIKHIRCCRVCFCCLL